MPTFSIIHTPAGRRLLHIDDADLPDGFDAERSASGWLCPLTPANAAALRQQLTWTAPTRTGLRKSIGLGDRLGRATVGHLRAVREGDMFPVLAQQSMREMQRASRTPQDVIDDATWGVLEADYRDGWGCDADHLKTTADIDACADAGYIAFTLDPGAYVDNAASDAAGKYGAALAHVAALSAHIARRMGTTPYDLEISVDETDSITTLDEHRWIVAELRRMGIPFTGLAPRFVGDFEKGVDYIGNVDSFEESFAQHADLCRSMGGYKLAIHSGSDKFSIFGIIAHDANPLVHLKTSGTSWLEALRVIAAHEPDMFAQILALAIEGYPQNRASYHVSGDPARIPVDASPAALLDQFDAREVLHVAFGAVLAQFRAPLLAAIDAHHAAYSDALHAHFRRHIQPFAG
ncbi:MAG: tagaturonate epimerase family protein [Chloroflexota bacterium]|nr:tagaturonate epimerase family protein [Chloroflexota bacterium]